MNPIYKFNLSVNGTSQQAFPLYGNNLAKEYNLQSGEQFFRASLSGDLEFVGPDFDRINGAAFDAQFGVEILISYDAGQTWTNYWRGQFWKTDCDFDLDSKSVRVKPAVIDQYTAILAGLDKEYNLIDLAPEIVPVRADKRPMIQVYVPGQTVIGCFLSGMWWEQECEAVYESDRVQIGDQSYPALTYKYYFALLKSQLVYTTSGAVTTEIVPGTDGNYTFAIRSEQSPSGNYWRAELVRLADGAMWDYETAVDAPEPTLPLTLSADTTTGATGTVVVSSRTINIYGRYVLDVAEMAGLATYPIPDDDLVPDNRNYSRVIGYAVSNTVFFSSQLTSTPTPWGIYQPGQYYAPPVNMSIEVFPIARSSWNIVSVWFAFASVDWAYESLGRAPFTIRDTYPLSSVISVLLGKIAPGITHRSSTLYSEFLYGTNPITGINQRLIITPKSNVISAGYDEPAQKAPITLRDVLNMLRDCFRCYWWIDTSNRLRIEHIEYFRRGGTYTGSPSVGVNLRTLAVTRNGKPWSFGRNQYKFDKPAMASRYQFGWMDDVTQLFEGYPIDIVSRYVNPESVEQITISRFTSDIDYVLLNPEAVSKDGFVLMSANSESGGYVLPYNNFVINGTDHYLQNAFVAFVFLQRYYAYDMPAENYTINGASYVALGVKKLKKQDVIFPAHNDPNLTQLIATELGNGTIEKLSVNLSSRAATATLSYDTE